MTTTEALQTARDKIADPKNWCQGSYAKDEDGNNCPTHSPEAVAWCARGAVGFMGDAMAYSTLSDACWHLNTDVPPNVNDYGTHADVMKMYDLAIRMSQESI